MSRRIPPTPVAAPWNGSTADGWLCDSTLKAPASPSPRAITPAFSPGPSSTRPPAARRVAGPLQHTVARRRQALQQERGVLVAAVLGPEQREDGELEMVRVAAE